MALLKPFSAFFDILFCFSTAALNPHTGMQDKANSQQAKNGFHDETASEGRPGLSFKDLQTLSSIDLDVDQHRVKLLAEQEDLIARVEACIRDEVGNEVFTKESQAELPMKRLLTRLCAQSCCFTIGVAAVMGMAALPVSRSSTPLV